MIKIMEKDIIINKIKICQNCGKEYLSNDKNSKFCSKSCSAKFNNSKRKLSNHTKSKISDSLKKYFNEKKSKSTLKKVIKIKKIAKTKRFCKKCGKELSYGNQSGYCSKCLIEERDAKLIEKWKNTGDTNCIPYNNIRNGIRRYIYKKQNNKCAICGNLNIWNGKHINFILDHIDGNAINNIEKNLRLICPNCDAQLPTYKSKNKHSARFKRRIGYKDNINLKKV